MAKLGKKQLDWLGPGWYWDYEGEADFIGRHAVNILTGERLSVRQAQDVQRGVKTLDEARNITRESRPELVREEGHYDVIGFTNLASAIGYCQRSDNFTFIVGHGKPTREYEGDIGGLGYRTLSGQLHDSSWYERPQNIAQIVNKFSMEFQPRRSVRFLVWERIR